jgi:type IV pilus assembly protein PilC
MEYAYVAFDEEGRLHRGRVEAADAREAERWAEERYLGVIGVRPVRRFEWRRLNVTLGGERVPPVETAFLLHQVAAMLRVGVSVGRALEMQAENTRHRRLRQIARALAERVARGGRVSEALALYPKVFGPIVVRMVRGAEGVGRLEAGLKDAGDHVMSGYVIAKRIAGAMYYPVFAMVLLVAAGVFMVWKVFPVLANMYEQFGVALPALTVWLIGFTRWAEAAGPYLAGGAALVAASAAAFLRTPRGRLLFDRYVLRAPVIGPVVRMGALTRFLRTLRSTLLSALPLDEAIELSAEATGNRHFAQEIEYARPQMVSGRGIAGPLRETGLFPPLVTQALDVGESTGTLDASLEGLVDYFEGELDRRVKGLADALNPILTVVAAAGVGFLMVATLLPMYYIMGHIKMPH